MSKNKKKLFDEDESEEEEVSLKVENEYAKKYDVWREKEEKHRLEQKYGSKVLDSDASPSSDSEDESDEPPEVSEEMEKQFLKTLALLKKKDPRIYDPKFKFFEVEEAKVEDKSPKKKELKFADSDEDSSDDGDGNIFKIEKKASDLFQVEKSTTKERKTSDSKESNLKDFLTGKAEHIDDPVEKDLEPLKALWSDPKLNDGEAFLRDYILNKRYLEEGDVGEAEDRLRDDEELEADQQTVEEQGKFERAYNFRFEEPDEDYLKRYPRTMNATRPKDDRRARKRQEIRERKELEKKQKMEEIARLKAFKLKEIQEKIAKIKEVTGNEELAFREEDIESDFDPDEHDRRMREMFDDNYYGVADEKKPEFPDMDEELEIENWEKYEGDEFEQQQIQNNEALHCEDEDFNMDADYDPKKARQNLLEEIQSTLGSKRKNRKKKSKLAKLLEIEKPKYIPTEANKTYSEYMEEYYKMDCEDVIAGEIPTRFKYRQVVPNDFGLSIEEILLADDKELTQWVPVKKLVKHRPEMVEKSEVNTYRLKAADERLKRKILPSLFKDLPEDPELAIPTHEKGKKKKKKKNKKDETNNDSNIDEEDTALQKEATEENQTDNVSRKKKKKKNMSQKQLEMNDTNANNNNKDESTNENDESTNENDKSTVGNLADNDSSSIVNRAVEESGSRKKKKKKKKKKNVENEIATNGFKVENIDVSNNDSLSISEVEVKSKKKKKKNTQINSSISNVVKQEHNSKKHKLDISEENQVPHKKKKHKNNDKQKQGFNKKFKHKAKDVDSTSNDPLAKLSDERLKAYGLNPKKYRSFLKYKKF